MSWGTDDWVALGVLVPAYGAAGYAVWRIGWRRTFQLLRDGLERFAQRLADGAQRASDRLDPTRCECPHPQPKPVPVELSDGTVVAYLCPECREEVFVPPTMALDLLPTEPVQPPRSSSPYRPRLEPGQLLSGGWVAPKVTTSCPPGAHTPLIYRSANGKIARAVCDDCGRDLPVSSV